MLVIVDAKLKYPFRKTHIQCHKPKEKNKRKAEKLQKLKEKKEAKNISILVMMKYESLKPNFKKQVNERKIGMK